MSAPKDAKLFKDFDWETTWLYYHADEKEVVEDTPINAKETTTS